MQPELQKVEEIFLGALDHSPETRTAFVRSVCAGDAPLAQEVSSMLRAHNEAHDFLEAPAFETNAFLLAQEEATLRPGELVGSYTVVSLLGKGGMGEVYLADDTELSRKVAIKLIRRHSGSVIHHLRREARILAGLNHPGIARLYGAAVTSDGVPYFVMEFVEGERLDRFCEQGQLTLRDRLVLFQKVCAAASYAHQHLIVHRDLKPANIRVTSEGEPKLLDFGIARVLDPDTTSGGDQTRFITNAMTPQYASPEQLRGESITTASDVYSLGIILFELLTCQRYSVARNTLPSKIRSRFESELKGDLDSIISKSLREEPQHRYSSVGQLAEDLRRYLNGLPVTARKGSRRYRAVKFVRRNRLAVIATAFVVLAIVGGAGATMWQARLARRAEEEAEAVSSFLEQMLSYSDPYLHSTSNASPSTSMNEVLDAAAKRLESGEFDRQPEVRAELERTIADSYFSQGRGQLGNKHIDQYIALASKIAGGNEAKLAAVRAARAGRLFGKGQLRDAETAFRELLPSLRREHAARRITAHVFIGSLNEFGYLRRTQGDSREAEAAFREALSFRDELPHDMQYVIGITRSTLASTMADEGKFAEAVATAQQAVSEARQLGFANTPSFGFSLTILGGLLSDNGEVAEASRVLVEGEQILRRFLEPSHLWLGDNLRNQSIVSYRQNRFDEAIAKAEQALSIYREGFGTHYDHYPTGMIVEGLSLARTGKLQEGETILRQAFQMRSESLPPQHFWVGEAKGALGECLAWEGRIDEARPFLTSSYETLKSDFGSDDPRTKEAARRADAYLR